LFPKSLIIGIHSNIKNDSTLLKLANENLLCRTYVRQRQRMQVRRPLDYLL